MNTIKVKTDKRVIEVSKLPIGKYAQLLNSIEELPKHISGLDSLSEETIISKAPQLIAACLPDVIKIITIATDATEEEVQEWGLEEATNVLLAILEVNKYKNVYENIKKAFSQQKQEALPA